MWSADSATLFFTTLDDNHRPCKVWRLALGDAPDAAELVYSEPDPGFFVSVDTTQSDRFILINAHDHATSETAVTEGVFLSNRPVRDADVSILDLAPTILDLLGVEVPAHYDGKVLSFVDEGSR